MRCSRLLRAGLLLALVLIAGLGSLRAGPTLAAGQVATCPSPPAGRALKNPQRHAAHCAAASAPRPNVVPSQSVTGSIPLSGDAATDVYNPVNNSVYVAIHDMDEVQVINSATNTVTATIAVGSSPAGTAVNPVTGTVYVVNDGDNTVSVIDPSTNMVTATLVVGPAGSGPTQLEVNPLTNKIYVANFNSGGFAGRGSVAVIDGATNAVTTVADPAGLINGPVGVTINPGTNTVYVANDRDGNVVLINGSTDSVIGVVPTSATELSGDRYDPANNSVYVGDFTNGFVYVIDAATNTLTATIVPPNASTVSNFGIDPGVNLVFENDAGNSSVNVIDSRTNTVIEQITDPNIITPAGSTVNQITHTVYVSDHSSDMAVLIDTYAPASVTPAAPTKQCGAATLGAGGSTSCTVTLTSAVGPGTEIVDLLASPQGATQGGCVTATGGLVCGITSGSQATVACPTTAMGGCPAGSSFSVMVSGAGGGQITELISISGVFFTVTATVSQSLPPLGSVPVVPQTAPTKTCTVTAPAVGSTTSCTLTLTAPLGPTSYLTDTLLTPAGALITSCTATGGLACQPGTPSGSVQVNCPGPSACAVGATVSLAISSSVAGSLSELVTITPAGRLGQSFTVTPSPAVSFGGSSTATSATSAAPVAATGVCAVTANGSGFCTAATSASPSVVPASTSSTSTSPVAPTRLAPGP